MEIVDALIVTLGLDRSAFDKGQADAISDLAKLAAASEQTASSQARSSSDAAKAQVDATSSASAAAKQAAAEQKKLDAASEKNHKDADAAEKARQQASVKRSKEIDDQAKKLGGTFGLVSGAATTMFAAISGGQGLAAFGAKVTAQDANIGRFAANIGIAAKSAQGWENALKAVGGAAGDAQGTLGAIQNQVQQGKMGIQTANWQYLAQLGIDPQRDLSDLDKALPNIATKAHAYMDGDIDGQKHTQADAVYRLKQTGLMSDSAINWAMLPADQRNAIQAKGMGSAADANIDQNAAERQRASQQLRDALTHVGSIIEDKLTGPLVTIADGLTGWLTRITQPGHEGELAGTAAGGVAAVIAANALKNKALKSVGTKIAEGIVGNALPAAAAPEAATGGVLGAVEAGAAAGGSVLGAGALALLGGLVVPTSTVQSGADEEAILKRHRDAWSADHKPSGKKNPFAPSQNGPKENTDAFWATFGNGLIEHLDSKNVSNSATAQSGALFKGLESTYSLPTGILDSVWSAESGRGKHMVSGAGAEGHFQFMPATSKAFGVNPWDLDSSATGAAKYFAQLLKMFRGDKDKAIASYNWGQGNVAKDVKRWGSDWANHLPAETSAYLAKVSRGLGSDARYSAPDTMASNARSGGSTSTVTIGDVHVHTAATDAKGMARDAKNELSNRLRMVRHADQGVA